MELKISEVTGGTTLGYGESRIKYYAYPDAGNFTLVLCSGGKVKARLILDSLEKLSHIKEMLGNNFRITGR